MEKIKNVRMIVITTITPTIIQFTLLSFLLVAFISFQAFGEVKLGDHLPKSNRNHIKKEGQAYRRRVTVPKYRANNSIQKNGKHSIFLNTSDLIRK